MILFENNSGNKKVNIWINETPIRYTKQKSLYIKRVADSNVCWYEGIICIEALLGPWNVSNYAMICMKYLNSTREDVKIIINYGMEEFFSSQVLPCNKKINVGLNVEFAEAVKEYFLLCSADKLPGGTIEILGGGFDEVGSSNIAFKKTMDILVFLFKNINQMNNLELKKQILENM